MRLLQRCDDGSLVLTENLVHNIPPYAILSHTWGEDDDEIVFKEIIEGARLKKYDYRQKPGFRKIEFCANQAAADKLHHFWIDTCCIDKSSATELQVALTSMFQWYQNATKCYVYLSDVEYNGKPYPFSLLRPVWDVAFRRSRWFTRGWTLQELLAPQCVEFFSRDGNKLGDRIRLDQVLENVTGINIDAFRGKILSEFSVRERLSWSRGRTTKREEDKSYSLMGIFGVSLPIIYGEGEKSAMLRLFAEIRRCENSQHMRPKEGQQDASTPGRIIQHADEIPSIPTESKRTEGVISVNSAQKHRQRLMDSLSFEMMGYQHAIITSVYSGTCAWLLNHPDYIQWLTPAVSSQHNGFLCIHGKRGAGKSVLMKYAYTHARRIPGITAVIFFFNRKGSALEGSMQGMYRSLLFQLLDQLPDIQEAFDATYSFDPYSQDTLDTQTLKRLLFDALCTIGQRQIRIFIDALDVCTIPVINRIIFDFKRFARSAENLQSNCQICFASRYRIPLLSTGLTITLEGQPGHNQDLKHYVNDKLQPGQGEPGHDKIIKWIRSQILQKADGLFLWVALVVDILNEELDHGDIITAQNCLQGIPNRLHELFQYIFTRIKTIEDDDSNPKGPFHCIRWILYGKKPLRLEQLYYTVVYDLNTERKNQIRLDFQRTTLEEMHRFVISCTKGLAKISNFNGNTVEFIHESVHDFADEEGLYCLAKSQQHNNQIYSFRGKYWTPLSWVAEKGRDEVVKLLLDSGAEVDSGKESGTTPLWFAAANGHTEVVQLLLEKGANLEYKNRAKRTPLSFAADRGHKDVVQLLLENGADPDSKDIDERTPLSFAIWNGHKEIVQLLLESGADLESKELWGRRTPLSFAAQNGHKDVVQLLLEDGADPDSTDKNERTPLSFAADRGHKDVVQLLLENDADPDSKDIDERTPLSFAIWNGSKEIVQLLLENGADPNFKDKNEQTPLSFAVQNEHKEIVQLLLKNGADSQSKDTSIRASPSRAAQGGHKGAQWSDYAFIKKEKYVDVAENIPLPSWGNLQEYETSFSTTYSDLGKHFFKEGSVRKTVKQDPDEEIQTLANFLDTTLDEPKYLANTLPDDTVTGNPSLSGRFSTDKTVLNELSNILIRGTKLKSVKNQTRDRLLSVLPRLIESFAERLAGSSDSSGVHRGVATILHKSNYKFSEYVLNRLTDSNRPLEDEEKPSSDASKHQGFITWAERMHTWQIHNEAIGGKALDPNKHDLNKYDDKHGSFKRAKRDGEGAKDDVENVNIQTLKLFEEAIVNSAAHSWLLLNLEKESGLIHGDPDVMNIIRNIVLSSLTSPSMLGMSTPLPHFRVTLQLDWNPLEFLSKQFSTHEHDVLGSTLTITGSFEDAQAATCIKYMQQTWPSSGQHIVDLLTEALSKPKQWVKGDFSDDTMIFAQLTAPKVLVAVLGNRDVIAEIIEQLAWVAAAIRLAPNATGVHVCTPSIHQTQIPDIVGGISVVDASFVISCEISSSSIQRHPTGQCWHGLFKSAMIVQGYPILRRAQPKTGLEIPLDIMATLVQARQITTFDRKFFLKGFSSMLTIMDQTEDSIVWHLNFNPDGKYISYQDASRPCYERDMDFEVVISSRHIVGWCSKAKFYTGTDKAPYPVKKPSLDAVSDECILYGIKPRVKIIERQHNYHLAEKERPLHMSYGEDDHRRRLERLKDKYVNLWDVEQKRGWLVNGISAWLHLLRARLKQISEHDNQTPSLKEPSVASRYTAGSSFEFFKNMANMELAVYSSRQEGHKRRFTIQDQSDLLYHILDNLIEHQDMAFKSHSHKSRKYLSGWAFRDLVMEKEQFEPYATTLPETGRSWVDFTRAISVVTLFGRGFGELISSDEACKKWANLPITSFLLATSGQVLKRVMDDVGNSPGQPWRLAPDIVWHNPTKSCDCGRNGSSNNAGNIQVLLPGDISKRLTSNSPFEELEDNSAFIFGFNPESSWSWPEFGDPTEAPSSVPESLKSPASMYDSAIGSDLGISGRSFASDKVYTVGIVCPLPREGAAMEKLFDQFHEETDNYTLGSIGKHNVALAYLPLDSGNVKAFSTVSVMANDFQTIKFGLLVGIAGGVPSATIDIRLGDVVVGVPGGTHPGVIQLGRGKDHENDRLEITGCVNRPPDRFLGIVSNVTSKPEECSTRLNDIIRSVTKSDAKYKYPGDKFDILDCGRCGKTCNSQESHFPRRLPRDSTHPVVHRGLIGSGETVVKDSKKRDQLGEQYGIICVEMEAAGVMNSDIPFLVVRGISDYADSNKNDLWHDYASLAAAAFAKLILDQFSGSAPKIERHRIALKRRHSQNNEPRITKRKTDENRD